MKVWCLIFTGNGYDDVWEIFRTKELAERCMAEEYAGDDCFYIEEWTVKDDV